MEHDVELAVKQARDVLVKRAKETQIKAGYCNSSNGEYWFIDVEFISTIRGKNLEKCMETLREHCRINE